MSDKKTIDQTKENNKKVNPLEQSSDIKDGYCSAEFTEGCILDNEKKYPDAK